MHKLECVQWTEEAHREHCDCESIKWTFAKRKSWSLCVKSWWHGTGVGLAIGNNNNNERNKTTHESRRIIDKDRVNLLDFVFCVVACVFPVFFFRKDYNKYTYGTVLCAVCCVCVGRIMNIKRKPNFSYFALDIIKYARNAHVRLLPPPAMSFSSFTFAKANAFLLSLNSVCGGGSFACNVRISFALILFTNYS